MTYNKFECDKCKKPQRVRHLIFINGERLCSRCRNRIGNVGLPINRVNLWDAINRVYVIKGYKNKKQRAISAYCSFPSILAGRKVIVVKTKKEVEYGRKIQGR